jgi:hypothetical protein
MGLLSDLLLFPVTGPVRGFEFILEQIKEQADAVRLDEGRVMAELMDLGLRRDLGEISDAEYTEQETALLERLNAIRAEKAGLTEFGTEEGPIESGTYVEGDES